jgi:hypothetical protein
MSKFQLYYKYGTLLVIRFLTKLLAGQSMQHACERREMVKLLLRNPCWFR